MKESFEKIFAVDPEGNTEHKEVTPEYEKSVNAWQKKVSEEERKQLGKWQKDYYEQEARLTSEEKAERQTKLEKENRTFIAQWFQDGIKDKNEYSEDLLIENDGSINREKRRDGLLPFILFPGKIKTPEDLYQLLYEIQQEHSDLDVSVEIDKKGKWIKYTAKEKLQK